MSTPNNIDLSQFKTGDKVLFKPGKSWDSNFKDKPEYLATFCARNSPEAMSYGHSEPILSEIEDDYHRERQIIYMLDNFNWVESIKLVSKNLWDEHIPSGNII